MLRVIPRMSGDIGILQRVKISEQALLIGLAVLNLFVCFLSMFVACVWLLLFVALVFYCFTFFAFVSCLLFVASVCVLPLFIELIVWLFHFVVAWFFICLFISSVCSFWWYFQWYYVYSILQSWVTVVSHRFWRNSMGGEKSKTKCWVCTPAQWHMMS